MHVMYSVAHGSLTLGEFSQEQEGSSARQMKEDTYRVLNIPAHIHNDEVHPQSTWQGVLVTYYECPPV